MADLLIEVCVDNAEGLAQAVAGGADRIELCAALDLGGLTPSVGFMRHAAGCGVPVMAMIRPRAGGFVYSDEEAAVMEADIASARQAGLVGVVLGTLRPDSTLDGPVLRRLVAAAQGMDLTLHRAFDLVPDMPAALDMAVALGFRRILTSGQAATAAQGRAMLARCVGQAAGRITIMPGAGIAAETLPALRGLPLSEVHASCSVPGPATPLGLGAARQTVAARVRALKAAGRGWGDAQLS
jgi:copper homeostasis protein